MRAAGRPRGRTPTRRDRCRCPRGSRIPCGRGSKGSSWPCARSSSVPGQQQGLVGLVGELVEIAERAVDDGFEVIALWNAPFHAAEPSDVPGELGLLLAFVEQFPHE